MVSLTSECTCADPGILFRGVQARQSENSLNNVFFFFFFLVHLILQFTEGVQWFITEKTILFQGSREGLTFSGGGGPTFFQRGPNANFYRNPYNFRVPTVREKSGKNEKKSRSGKSQEILILVREI